MVNSCRKGKKGELEFVHFLKEHDINARRGQQFKGTPDSPDIISDFDKIHFEVKRVEQLRLYQSLEQAEEDARKDQTPVVVHRRNNKKWIAIMDAEEFVELVKKAER
jgi:Holliday junction resolvase